MSSLVDNPAAPSHKSLPLEENSPDHSQSGNEFYRKLLHMLPGLLPFGLRLLPHDDPPDWIAMSIVVAVVVLLTGIYIKLRWRVSREGETNFLSSALSYPAAVVGTMLVFPSHAEFAMTVVILIALGDGFAYICGKRFGRRKLPWNPEKSWAGTIGFVLFSTPVASLAFWLEAQNPDVPFLLAAACCSIAAIASALAESWPTQITDNLRVGVTAAVAVSLSYFGLSSIWM